MSNDMIALICLAVYFVVAEAIAFFTIILPNEKGEDKDNTAAMTFLCIIWPVVALSFVIGSPLFLVSFIYRKIKELKK